MASVTLYRIKLDQEITSYRGTPLTKQDPVTRQAVPWILRDVIIESFSALSSTEARPIGDGTMMAAHALAKKIGEHEKPTIDLELQELELVKAIIPASQGLPLVLIGTARDMLNAAEAIEYKPHKNKK